jgi:hypothetical protein
MPSSSRLFVALFIVNAILVLILDIVANVVPNLLPTYITQSPLVVGLLLAGLLVVVIVLGLGLQVGDGASMPGDRVAVTALRSFAAFAGIAVGIAAGIVLAPTVVDYGDRALKSASALFTAASLKLDPLSGPAGTEIVATGLHFTPDTPVVIYAGGVPMDSVRTDEAGGFSMAFRFPAVSKSSGQSNGVFKVEAIDEAGKGRADAGFVLKVDG